ncbi:MAG: DedA family protein [Phycisphaeraceae bacterium]
MDWFFVELPLWVDQAGPVLVVLVFAVILISGFGLPLPEDIPLIVAGYLCYRDVVSLWYMIPAVFIAVVGADCTLYWIGRRYGIHLPNIWLLRHYLTPQRLARAERAFHAHGGKTLFISRFLPGLRAPTYFTAGMFRIPFWKMLLFDGTAALLSVPTIVLLAYFFGTQLEMVHAKAAWAGRFIAIGLILAIAGVVAYKFLRARRVAPGGVG